MLAHLKREISCYISASRIWAEFIFMKLSLLCFMWYRLSSTSERRCSGGCINFFSISRSLARELSGESIALTDRKTRRRERVVPDTNSISVDSKAHALCTTARKHAAELKFKPPFPLYVVGSIPPRTSSTSMKDREDKKIALPHVIDKLFIFRNNCVLRISSITFPSSVCEVLLAISWLCHKD